MTLSESSSNEHKESLTIFQIFNKMDACISRMLSEKLNHVDEVCSNERYSTIDCVNDFKSLSKKTQIFFMITLFSIVERDKYQCYRAQLYKLISCSMFCEAVTHLINSISKENVVSEFCNFVVGNCKNCQIFSSIAQKIWELENTITEENQMMKPYESIRFIKQCDSDKINWELQTKESSRICYQYEALRAILPLLYHSDENKQNLENTEIKIPHFDKIDDLIKPFENYPTLKLEHIKKYELPCAGTVGLTWINQDMTKNGLMSETEFAHHYSLQAHNETKELARASLLNQLKTDLSFGNQLENNFQTYLQKYNFLLSKPPKNQTNQVVCGLCRRKFRNRVSKKHSRKYFVVHQHHQHHSTSDHQGHECPELFHKKCLLQWIIYHNAYLLHWGGNQNLCRYIRTINVTYPCPSCRKPGNLISKPLKNWVIDRWSNGLLTKDTDDTFSNYKRVDNQKVYGVSYRYN